MELRPIFMETNYRSDPHCHSNTINLQDIHHIGAWRTIQPIFTVLESHKHINAIITPLARLPKAQRHIRPTGRRGHLPKSPAARPSFSGVVCEQCKCWGWHFQFAASICSIERRRSAPRNNKHAFWHHSRDLAIITILLRAKRADW